jgi:hypothetical protein
MMLKHDGKDEERERVCVCVCERERERERERLRKTEVTTRVQIERSLYYNQDTFRSNVQT